MPEKKQVIVVGPVERKFYWTARQLQARVTWGDYVTEPRLDDAVFLERAREAAEERGEVPKPPSRSVPML